MDEALGAEIAHLRTAVSIGVDRKLNKDTVALLGNLEQETVRWLRDMGYRYLAIPPDSDRVNSTYVSKLYGLLSHKAAATCSGLGWIGKNGLLINSRYGPRLTFATVLTDAPLEADKPIDTSECGQCSLCVQHCPAEAISGTEWSRETPFPNMIDHARCRKHKEASRRTFNKPNCGLCINICPYGRKNTNGELTYKEDFQEEERCHQGLK